MTDAPIHFATAAAFRRWLRAHHATADHLIVRIAKAHALSSGIGYAEAKAVLAELGIVAV